MPLDDLAEYLTFDFDPDRVLGVPKNSVVALSASRQRRSHFNGRLPARITLDLQPAFDVARMMTRYWKSEVWAARVMFDLFDVLGDICQGRSFRRAAEFLDQFSERRLGHLISDSPVGIPDRLPLGFTCRAHMFGSLDERKLVKQLATFQIFHEVGHLVELRQSARRGPKLSPEEEELMCDDFACGELRIAYDGSLGIEFLESSPVSIFLSILIWTLAEHIGVLDDADRRVQLFDLLLRRARAATYYVHCQGHPTEPPSEESEGKALRHFPVFDAMLRILDTFFVEAISADSEMFDFRGFEPEPELTIAKTPAPRLEEAQASEAPWEVIWTKEDEAAEKKAELFCARPEARGSTGLG
jgi:hypothetical protein